MMSHTKNLKEREKIGLEKTRNMSLSKMQVHRSHFQINYTFLPSKDCEKLMGKLNYRNRYSKMFCIYSLTFSREFYNSCGVSKLEKRKFKDNTDFENSSYDLQPYIICIF